MKKFALFLNIIFLVTMSPLMAQEKIKLAIENFQVAPALAETLSSTNLSTRLRHIAAQYNAKYEIIESMGMLEEILRRLRIECQLVNCDLEQYSELEGIEADKILKPQVSFSQHQLTLSARLLNKKSFRQERTYHKKITSHTVTDEDLCLFWQQIEPNVNFLDGICVPKIWECYDEQKLGDVCPVTLEEQTICTIPTQLAQMIPFQIGHCSVNVFTQGPLNEFILKPKHRIARLTVKSLLQTKACITLSDSPAHDSIRAKIRCEK